MTKFVHIKNFLYICTVTIKNINSMTKDEMIKQMAECITTNWCSYGTWSIECALPLPVNEEDDMETVVLKDITHQEEDHIGIFDGEKYNELCGFGSMEELKDCARNEGLTVEDIQESVWYDSANEDNYEPDEDRRLRLAERLYENVLVYRDEFEYLDVNE